jgi:hypothetical protein
MRRRDATPTHPEPLPDCLVDQAGMLTKSPESVTRKN